MEEKTRQYDDSRFLVSNWMKRELSFLHKNITVEEAALMMVEKNIDFLPVVDELFKPIGVVTTLSTLKELMSGRGKELVSERMVTENIDIVHEDDSILEIYHAEKPYSLVVNHECTYMGVLTHADIVNALIFYFQEWKEIRNTAEVLNIILDSAYEGVAVVDENGIITHFNDAYSRFTGIKKSAAIGRNVQEVIDNTNLHNTVKTGLPERGVIQYINGQPMVVNRIPIFQNGRVVGAIGMLIFEGVTELYRIYERFREKSLLHQDSKHQPVKKEKSDFSLNQIIGESEPIHYLKKIVKKIAKTEAGILITGESGTGKEMFARSIHQLSTFSSGPFVSVNCGAIPEQLFESELFGYEEGAFTGAKKGGKPGKMELAQNGTLFLDEIGELPLLMQTKLLRVIQEREYERVGGVKKLKMNARIIAATNRDLKKMVENGDFREDLYYRINIIELQIPPLRDRIGDIPLLINYFLEKSCKKYGIRIKRITSEAMNAFLHYEWYGNIRELANTIEKLVILCEDPVIDLNYLPKYMKDKELFSMNYEPIKRRSIIDESKIYKMEREKEMISEMLKRTGGNKSKAAKLLGIHRTTLHQKLKKYGML
ncbi:sigma 54-interacting transcriptional regulator [Caldifermentibacillus hisashii]|uniref:sigma 54-interacting transcriptional regulator n=1 Tax=Caldifermentibacillus hisashii TaxID=996558 RepID=UPI0031FC059F